MAKHEAYDTAESGYVSDPAASKEHRTHKEKDDSYPDVEHGRKSHGPVSIDSVGRALGSRGFRALRRSNLPFLIVFLTALCIFFGALMGIGYVDPESQAPAPESEFVMGQPVFDPAEGRRLREIAMAEQRALEQEWRKKKRPNAGAWMNAQRNDGAVRASRPKEEAAAEAKRELHNRDDD